MNRFIIDRSKDLGWLALVDINFTVYGICPYYSPNRLRGLNGLYAIEDNCIYTSDARNIIIIYRGLAHIIEKKLRNETVQIDKTKVFYDRGILVNKAGVYLQDVFIKN